MLTRVVLLATLAGTALAVTDVLRRQVGSAALHPIWTTIAGSQATNATRGIGLFTAGGMVG